jgi:hypothetical protein
VQGHITRSGRTCANGRPAALRLSDELTPKTRELLALGRGQPISLPVIDRCLGYPARTARLAGRTRRGASAIGWPTLSALLVVLLERMMVRLEHLGTPPAHVDERFDGSFALGRLLNGSRTSFPRKLGGSSGLQSRSWACLRRDANSTIARWSSCAKRHFTWATFPLFVRQTIRPPPSAAS